MFENVRAQTVKAANPLLGYDKNEIASSQAESVAIAHRIVTTDAKLRPLIMLRN